MRLWSIHSKYLDAKGLVAVWREGLLAKKYWKEKLKDTGITHSLKDLKNQKIQLLASMRIFMKFSWKRKEEGIILMKVKLRK
ncbi:MAG: hypothetical protein PWR13_285 [Archaeoglobi archaeon]|nr:hypothetical protein [Archaeoglobi archaeon]MDK2781257.1 hypothetical protein [Archaeoglobi archaeon]